MKNKYKKKKGAFALMFIALFFAISGAVMLLWNAILPDLFDANSISYWQSMGLLVLSRILFGRIGKPNKSEFVNRKFKEKFRNMTLEEKEEFKANWNRKCGE